MFLDCTPEHYPLLRRLGAYIAVPLTPDLSEAVGGSGEECRACRDLVRQLGRC
jgi:3-oxocholest-4-en-26-oyl-CoA dehydrogenase alpha subunit